MEDNKHNIPLTSCSQFNFLKRGGKKIDILLREEKKEFKDVVNIGYHGTSLCDPPFMLFIRYRCNIHGVGNWVVNSHMMWGSWLSGKKEGITKYPYEMII